MMAGIEFAPIAVVKRRSIAMKMFLFIVSCISFCDSTILAATGYIASSSPIRNVLISSGIGGAIRDSANSFYAASTLRHASDQGTDVRRAVMNDHSIVEVGVDTTFHKRGDGLIADKGVKGDDLTPNNGFKDEGRVYSERLFSVLNQMNKNTCISKLLCEIGANPNSFGIIGLKINNYVRSVPPVTYNSVTFPYIEAFQAGSNEGSGVCLQHYTGCTYNLNRIVYLLWGMTHHLSF